MKLKLEVGLLSTYIVQDEENLSLSRGSRGQRSDTAQACSLREASAALGEGGSCPLREQRAGWTGSAKGGASKYHFVKSGDVFVCVVKTTQEIIAACVGRRRQVLLCRELGSCGLQRGSSDGINAC